MRVLWIASAADSNARVRPDLELARALASAGVELHLVAPDGALAQGFAAARLNWAGPLPRRWLGREAMNWLQQGCAAAGIEVVHLLDRTAAIAALPALEPLPAAILLRHERPGGTQRWNPLARLSVLSRRLDAVACRCEAARVELARRREPATLCTLRPAFSPEWLDGPAVDFAAMGIPPDAFRVAVIGDYRPRKGIEVVVDAAQWLAQGTSVHFLLVGRGLETRSVLERIARSPWRRNFHLLGPRDDAPRIAARCHVSVRGAQRLQGVPQAIMESMAAGVPAVMTAVGGAAELVEDGVSGLLVPPRNARAIGEALRWLVAHPARRRAMGDAARLRIAAEFDPARALEAHLSLYRRLAAGAAILRGEANPGGKP